MRANRGSRLVSGDEALSSSLATGLLVAVSILITGGTYVWASGFEGGGPHGSSNLVVAKRTANSREAKLLVEEASEDLKWEDLTGRLDGDEVPLRNQECSGSLTGPVEVETTFCVQGLNLEGSMLAIVHGPSGETLTTVGL